jgi:HEAT repeat protein
MVRTLYLLGIVISSLSILPCRSSSSLLAQDPQLETQLKRLRGGSQPIVRDAAKRIAEMGCKAEPAFLDLVSALKSQRDARDTIIFAVGQIGDSCGSRLAPSSAASAVPLLVSNLSMSEPINVQEVAAFALGRLETSFQQTQNAQLPVVISALMAAASNRDPKVERAAVEAIGRFRKANLVQEQAADVLATIIHALREGNDKHIPDLQRTACGALDSFGSLAEAALGDLAGALRSPIPDIRRAAAFTLAHIGRRANQPQAVEGLLEALATGGPRLLVYNAQSGHWAAAIISGAQVPVSRPTRQQP